MALAVASRSVSKAAVASRRVAKASTRRPVRVQASFQAEKAAAVAGATAVAMALAPAAHAAQEAMMVAEGEPLIVQIGWASVCVMFSFSLSLVVWGRSGM